jgi:hypothetical protein
MSTNNVNAPSPASKSPPPAPPPQTSSARLIVLLGILALAIGALVYDFTYAKPGSEATRKKIDDFVDARNRMSVVDSKLVTPDDIHKEIGMMPTWVDKHPEDQYQIEYYCWWGSVPVLNMRRHFLAVIYTGPEPGHFSSMYANTIPPRDALPLPEEPATADSGPLPPLETSDAKPKDTDAPAAKDAEPAAATEPPAAKEEK